MPSVIFAPIKITGAEGAVTFGDVLQITPKSTTKANAGSGGGNVGDFSATFTAISLTNTLDADVNDSNNQANN